MQIWSKNWKKIAAGKNSYFWPKIAIYLSECLQEGRPSYRKSLQPSEENIQRFKTWNSPPFFYFCGSFLPAWIRNPDPRSQCGTGPRTLIKSIRFFCFVFQVFFPSLSNLIVWCYKATPTSSLRKASLPSLHHFREFLMSSFYSFCFWEMKSWWILATTFRMASGPLSPGNGLWASGMASSFPIFPLNFLITVTMNLKDKHTILQVPF